MRQWIDRDALVLVVEQDDGSMSVTTRPERDAVWGPPIAVAPDPTLEEWQRRRREREAGA